MTNHKALIAAIGLLVIGAVWTAPAQASRWDKKTNIKVHEPIEIPGAVLQPGNYVIQLVDSQSNRHIVQFSNSDETQTISTVIAIPNRRLQPTGDTKFAWYETPAGSPPALRAWFYPGDNFGQEFVYPERRARQLAKVSKLNVTTVPDSADESMKKQDTVGLRTVTIAAISPDEQKSDPQTAATQNEAAERQRPARSGTREPIMAKEERDDETTTLAQAQPRSQPRSSQSSSPERLPDTAGGTPLLGLIGLLSLGGAFGLRFVAQRMR